MRGGRASRHTLSAGGEKRKGFVAILASRATRPVRWRRHLRAACFWLALALRAAAVAKEIAGPLFYLPGLPPLALALRQYGPALGARECRARADRHLGRRTSSSERRALRAPRARHRRRLRELDRAGRLRRRCARGAAPRARAARRVVAADGTGRSGRAHPPDGDRRL